MQDEIKVINGINEENEEIGKKVETIETDTLIETMWVKIHRMSCLA